MWNKIKSWFTSATTFSKVAAKKTFTGIKAIASTSWTGIRWTGRQIRTIASYCAAAGRWLKNILGVVLNQHRSAKEWVGQLYFPDLRFNPITWNLVFRPVASGLAGLSVASIVKSTSWALLWLGLLPVDPISVQIFFAIAALVFLEVVRPENTLEKVPETDYGALVTFIGIPMPVIRTSGEYSWLGKRLRLDRSRKPFAGVSDTVGNSALEAGYIPLGDITFQVWDSAHAESKEKRSSLTRPAKNRSPVTGSLTLIGNFSKPRLWLRAVDPALDIGDRARQEYQEIIETLIDTDVSALQAKMQDYLFGKTLVTSFVTESVAGHKAGAMLRDVTGLIMCDVVQEGETVDQVKRRFLNKVTAEADPKMMKVLTNNGKRAFPVIELRVSNPLFEVTEERGMNLHRVTFGDVTLAQKVSAAAEQASAEADERISQLASAKTIKEARKILKPTTKELENSEIYQLTTILAAAADDKNGNIRVVMVPGGDRLANSIVAAGQQIGGNKP